MNQFRLILPPSRVVIHILCLPLLVYVSLMVAFITSGHSVLTYFERYHEHMGHLHMSLLCMIAAGYGAWRLLYKHPMTRPKYLEWLGNTPWTKRHPLPDGPVLLIWQDAIIIGVLQFLIWLNAEPIAFLGVIVFSYGYLLPCALYLRILKQHVAAYSICLWLTLPFIWGENSLAVFMCCILPSLIISQIALPKSLETCVGKIRHGDDSQALSKVNPAVIFRMTMEPPKRFLSRAESVAISVLLGILFSIWLGDIELSEDGTNDIPYIMIVGAPILINLGCFYNRHQPMLSLAGRIKSGRWLIPKFDSIFLAPLLVLVVTWILHPILNSLAIPPGTTTGITVTYTLLILLNVGPTEKEFNLTGAHQIRSATQTRVDGSNPNRSIL